MSIHKVPLIMIGILMVPVLLFGLLWLYTYATYTPSRIIDFRPTTFQARADESFFYSIGDELKHGDQIDMQRPTLYRGEIRSFLVSPDQRKIAITGDKKMMIVSLDGTSVREVTPVDSIYKEPKPLGQSFFRDQEFQWSKDSRMLYLVKDKYYESKGSQLFSKEGELWKYDLLTGNLAQVLKPFPAYNYFFDAQSEIYFSVPTPDGDLILKKFNGSKVSEVPTETVASIPSSRLVSESSIESPFYSFEDSDSAGRVPDGVDLRLSIDAAHAIENVGSRSKTFLSFSEGKGFKGKYYCTESSNLSYLPGNRYLLFPVYCKDYDGKLLIDMQTGQYETLPKDVRLYRTFNTDTYPHYHLGGGGISRH